MTVDVKVDHNFHLRQTDKVIKWESSQSEEYKEYRSKWVNWPKRFKLDRVPIHLDIEATSNCNLLCTMCARTTMVNDGVFWKVENFDFSLYVSIIDEFSSKGGSSLKLQYLGEPLMNPKIFDMVRYAKDCGLVDVMFNTNATNLTEKKALAIFDSGLDKLFFSFDSPNKEHYQNIRVKANYDKVLRNIYRFCDLKTEKGYDRPFTRVSMVKLEGYQDEWDSFVALFEDKVDGIAGLDLMDHYEFKDHLHDPFEESFVEQILGEINSMNDGGIGHLASESDVLATDRDSKVPFCCPQLWQRMFIHPDGVVTACCVDTERSMKMGNIKDSSIEEIWHNDRYQFLRQAHQSGLSHRLPACASCGLANTL